MSDPRMDVQDLKTLDDAITRTLAEYQTLHERTIGTLETMAQNLRGDELWPTDVAGPMVMLQRTYNERRERLDAEWRRLLQQRLALIQGQTGQQWAAHLELTERIKAEKLPDLLEIEIPPLRRDQTVTVATTREFYEMTIRRLRECATTFAAIVALWQSGPTVIWGKIETDGERKEVTPDFHLRDRVSRESPTQHQSAEPPAEEPMPEPQPAKPGQPLPPPPPIVVPSETGQPAKPSVEPPKPSPAGPALPDKKKAESAPAPAVIEPTHFTAYAPKEVPPDTWANLSAYIFRTSASGAVENDAQQKFGAQLAEMRQGKATASAEIEAGATITATPRLDGFTFNPESLSLKFVKPYHRFDFEMMAGRERLNLASNGAITFSMGGVLIGEIPLSVFVSERATIEIGVVQAEPYQKIFCSYSHRDTRVVERVERAYRVLGFDYLRDVTRLRSGQQWNAELMRWIDEAHIFQLFWSAAAAGSPYVEQEWRHALQISRANFIRPVYWKKPLTAPPSELGQLHFAYDPQIQGAAWWNKVVGLVRGE